MPWERSFSPRPPRALRVEGLTAKQGRVPGAGGSSAGPSTQPHRQSQAVGGLQHV